MKPVKIKIERVEKRKAPYSFKVHKIPRLMNYPVRPRTLPVENKFYQTSVTLTPTGGDINTRGFNGANAGVCIYLNNIRQGSADGQRIGKKYNIKNISFLWQCDAGSTAPLTVTYQWGIILDKQANGTNLVMADAFDFSTGRVDALIKSDNTSKYKILDRYICHTSSTALDGNEWNASKNGVGFLSFSKKGGLPVMCYNSDNGNVTDVQSGAIYFYLIANIANADHYFNLRYRIKYTDA